MDGLRRRAKRNIWLAAHVVDRAASRISSWQRSLRCGIAALACVVGLVCAVGAAPASAGTPVVDGISDQNLGLWIEPVNQIAAPRVVGEDGSSPRPGLAALDRSTFSTHGS